MFQNWPKLHATETDKSVLAKEREERRNRFRILVCIDGSPESMRGIKEAREIKPSKYCDIILLYVRSIDQGLRTGGLQMKIARENMLEWGLELPGIGYLKEGLSMLVNEQDLKAIWQTASSHTDSWGDPVGDNKVEYRHPDGRSIVLKLKTAPDPASGILDQYELGPYNLIIMGAPKRWRNEFGAFFGAPVAQKVATLSPCSVLLSRNDKEGHGSNGKNHLICISMSKHSLDAMRRDAVLAYNCGHSISLFTVINQKSALADAERLLYQARESISKIGVEIKDVDIGVGDPVTEIIKKSSGYNLISVAASSKKWYKRFFTTGVAFKVMAASDSTVLNIR